MHITKRLVYHLYLYDGCFDSKIYKLHLQCLHHYAHIFDEAIFVLTLDEVNNENLIKLAKNTILDIFFTKDIKFIVRENTTYREAATFFEEIVSKLDKLDGITFFGHIKGAGNQFNPDVNMDEVYTWVTAAYFLNLEYMWEVEWYLVSSPSFSTYGALKCYWEDVENIHHWLYSGTFFWLNCQRVSGVTKKKNIPIPPLNNRYCAETFCGNILEFDNAESASHNLRLAIGSPNERCMNWYGRASEFINIFHNNTS